MLTAILHHAFAGDGVPEWVHLVPGGTFKGIDGRGPFRLADPQAVISASLPAADARLPIDENHSTDLAAPKGEPSPARGWIVEIQHRADGLWGRVEWTESGRQMVADKQYRGLSPVFERDAQGRVLKVLRAALTNNPNLTQLATLNHQEEHTMDLARMRTALGLPAEADEAAILAAIEASAQERTTLNTQLAASRTELQTVRATAVRPELVVELQAQIATMQSTQARERATAFVDGAIAKGKPVAIKEIRQHYIERHMAEPAAVEMELNAMPSLHAGGVGGRTERNDPQDGDGLTDEEAMMARKMRLDPKKYAEELRKSRRAA